MSEHASRQPSQPPIEPGTLLIGKYRVERVIGRGGMGVVVEARHLALDERVAVKFLLPDHALNAESSARFLREARASVRIKSEHVARVSDVGTLENGAPYMVMEFLVGQDLAQVLHERGPLHGEEAVDYVIQGCEAIAEAHGHGIVHRDLKPSNLFLTSRNDGTPLVKVLDFGISKLLHERVDNLTRTTAAMGSALYMSPEQMQQTRSVDHRTDIYALGVALFELCAGRPPYYAETLPQLCAEVLTGIPTPLRDLRPDLPEAFAVVLAKAYARDREHRYATVAEMAMALAPFAAPQTHPLIERIARMGGVRLSDTGQGYRQAFPSSPHQTGGALGSPLPTAPAAQVGSGPQQPVQAISAPYASASASQSQPLRAPSQPAVQPSPPSPSHPSFPSVATTPVAVPSGPFPGAQTSRSTGGVSMPAAPPGSPGGEQITPGHYAGPMSSRAAASFATGNATGTGVPAVSPKRPAVGVIVAMIAAALTVGSVVGVIVLRARSTSTPAAGQETTPSSGGVAPPTASQVLPPASSQPTPAAVQEPASASPSGAAPSPSASAMSTASTTSPPDAKVAAPYASASTPQPATPTTRGTSPGTRPTQPSRPTPAPVDLNSQD
ncbi:serine/threonine-protein kinase [Chondromyces apiculatus]|uniref:Serine/threonine-protein kinase pkn3 n=1 Tax=Chondromyces apiculatus DSM 436 TaxID=1192034 RepID=A0A017T8N5_9BACT|nr:serine/threonine-protein kinase [Chondromyces apiculatus]EYF05608.1 Serine/threonine-protein kinase pkn3 [Chondromyces apiculatus DSM 436]